jgi:hypothetical protein
LETPKRRDHSEELGVDIKIILGWILGKWGGELLTGFIWLRTGPVTGCCEHSNEHSASIKGGEILD